MKTKIVLQAAAAAALLFAGTGGGALAATIVTNGSFEDITNFTDNTAQDNDSLAAGSSSMTGWTVGSGHKVSWIGPTNPFGLSAQEGSYLLDLTDYNDGAPYGGVSQTISTVAGGHYDLTFYLGSSGTPNGITASAGATTQDFPSTLNASNVWEAELLSFVATGASTLLTFQGSAGGNYIGLDNIAVTFTGVVDATPIPGSILMLGTGLLGLGFAGYRRSKKARSAAPNAI